MRNGCFCGVVQKRASVDFGRLIRAVGAGYVVEGHVVSASISRAVGSRGRIVVGSISYKITGRVREHWQLG